MANCGIIIRPQSKTIKTKMSNIPKKIKLTNQADVNPTKLPIVDNTRSGQVVGSMVNKFSNRIIKNVDLSWLSEARINKSTKSHGESDLKEEYEYEKMKKYLENLKSDLKDKYKVDVEENTSVVNFFAQYLVNIDFSNQAVPVFSSSPPLLESLLSNDTINALRDSVKDDYDNLSEVVEKQGNEYLFEMTNITDKEDSVYKKLHSGVYLDEKTGIFNQRGYLVVKEKLNEIRKNNNNTLNKELFIAVSDGDNFKNLNDLLGPVFGDLLIRKAYGLAEHNFLKRMNDIGSKDSFCISIREGGEEFTRFIYGYTEKQVKDNLEILRKEVGNIIQDELEVLQKRIPTSERKFREKGFSLKEIYTFMNMASKKGYKDTLQENIGGSTYNVLTVKDDFFTKKEEKEIDVGKMTEYEKEQRELRIKWAKQERERVSKMNDKEREVYNTKKDIEEEKRNEISEDDLKQIQHKADGQLTQEKNADEKDANNNYFVNKNKVHDYETFIKERRIEEVHVDEKKAESQNSNDVMVANTNKLAIKCLRTKQVFLDTIVNFGMNGLEDQLILELYQKIDGLKKELLKTDVTEKMKEETEKEIEELNEKIPVIKQKLGDKIHSFLMSDNPTQIKLGAISDSFITPEEKSKIMSIFEEDFKPDDVIRDSFFTILANTKQIFDKYLKLVRTSNATNSEEERRTLSDFAGLFTRGVRGVHKPKTDLNKISEFITSTNHHNPQEVIFEPAKYDPKYDPKKEAFHDLLVLKKMYNTFLASTDPKLSYLKEEDVVQNKILTYEQEDRLFTMIYRYDNIKPFNENLGHNGGDVLSFVRANAIEEIMSNLGFKDFLHGSSFYQDAIAVYPGMALNIPTDETLEQIILSPEKELENNAKEKEDKSKKISTIGMNKYREEIWKEWNKIKESKGDDITKLKLILNEIVPLLLQVEIEDNFFSEVNKGLPEGYVHNYLENWCKENRKAYDADSIVMITPSEL